MPCYGLEIRLSGNLPILVMGLGKVNFEQPKSALHVDVDMSGLRQIQAAVDIEDVAGDVGGFVAR